MPQKIAMLMFVITVLIDVFVSSLFGYPSWFPYFSLSVMPAIVMFGTKKSPLVVTILQSLVLWLFAGLNLGMAVFATGLLLIVFKDVVKNIFHTTTWQAAAAASFVLAISLLLLATLSNFLSAEFFLTTRFMIAATSTAILSFIISLIVQRRYVQAP